MSLNPIGFPCCNDDTFILISQIERDLLLYIMIANQIDVKDENIISWCDINKYLF